MNRQKVVLCVLLVVFAGSLVYSYLRSPKEQPVVAKSRPVAMVVTAARKGTPAASGGAIDDTRLHLELLDRQLPRFSGFRRNIFSPVFKDELKPPPFKPLPPPPLPVVKELPPPPPPIAMPQAPPPPTMEQIADAELAKFTFLGFMKKGTEKTVFLSSNGQIYLAKTGSSLGPKFQVSDLTDEAITVKSVAGGREVVIPLVENRALTRRPGTGKRTP